MEWDSPKMNSKNTGDYPKEEQIAGEQITEEKTTEEQATEANGFGFQEVEWSGDEPATGPASWVWVKQTPGRRAVLGLTQEALEACGLIVHVELPDEGDHVLEGHPCLMLETLKGEIELPTPVSGRVILVNGLVERNPGLLYLEPGQRSWLLEIEVAR